MCRCRHVYYSDYSPTFEAINYQTHEIEAEPEFQTCHARMARRARYLSVRVAPSGSIEAPLRVEPLHKPCGKARALHQRRKCLEVVEDFVIRFVRRIDEQARKQLPAAIRSS